MNAISGPVYGNGANPVQGLQTPGTGEEAG